MALNFITLIVFYCKFEIIILKFVLLLVIGWTIDTGHWTPTKMAKLTDVCYWILEHFTVLYYAYDQDKMNW